MERLTQYTPKGASLILDSPKTDAEARTQVTEKFKMACNRLAAYEDTGLTPEEITANMEMFAAYRHVCGGKSPDEVTQAFAENARLCAERDKAVEDMTSIADAIANCKEYLSGGRDKVSSLQLGRCPACKAQCHDDKPCKFEWRGTEGKA